MGVEEYIRYAIFKCLIFPCACFYVTIWILHGICQLLTGKGWSCTNKYDVEPAQLCDPNIGKHGYLELKERDGIKIHYVANGDRCKPLMLFLHGFPQFWYMWKEQLKEFGRDYYAVAIDLPGYGNSSIPVEKSRYTAEEISVDVREFILELGYTSCILVGHDWGAVIAFEVAIEHPHVVDKLINMNVPHKRAFKDNSSLAQLWRSSYIFFFQVPYLPEYMLSSMNYASLNFLQKYTSSDYFTDDEVDIYKYAFHKSGFTAPLNYYRANIGTRESDSGMGKVVMPSLLIWGTDDHFLGVELAAGTEKYLENGKVVYVDNISHFVNTDAPDVVHRHMREFLDQC